MTNHNHAPEQEEELGWTDLAWGDRMQLFRKQLFQIFNPKQYWGLLMLVALVPVLFIVGFGPMVRFEDHNVWYRWVVLGFYTSWALRLTAFYVSGGRYEFADGFVFRNVNPITAFLSVGSWLLVCVIQQITMGEVVWVYMVILAIVQISPAFTGELFREQARYEGLLLANCAFIATAIWMMATG